MRWDPTKPSNTVATAHGIKQQMPEEASQRGGPVRRRTKGWLRWLAPLTLIFSDALLAVLIWLIAYAVQSTWGQGPLYAAAIAAAAASTVVWIAIRALIGLYPGYGLSPAERLRRHTYSVFISLAIVSIFALVLQLGGLLSRLLLVSGFLGLLLLAPLGQALARWGVRGLGLWGRPVLIVGYADTSAQTVKLLEEEWDLGYDPIAVFDQGVQPSAMRPQPASYEEMMSQVEDIARSSGVDTIIFAMPHTRREHLAPLIRRASLSFRHILIIPNLIGLTNSAVTARDLAGTLAVEIKYNLLSAWALRAKRVLDLGATVLGGFLALPVLLVIALLIYVESGRPVFYADWRMGRNGTPFPCMKFRTMVPRAEDVLQLMLAEDAGLREEYAKYHKLRSDPRVTRVGRFLRRTSLDELPQLWNVLRGEMSLVGPRPYLPRESGEIGEAKEEILRVPPGITGPWQVLGRNHTPFAERVEMDVYYVRDWSVWLDIVLLARTVRALFIDRGAY